jgi:hypothetical protein
MGEREREREREGTFVLPFSPLLSILSFMIYHRSKYNGEFLNMKGKMHEAVGDKLNTSIVG